MSDIVEENLENVPARIRESGLALVPNMLPPSMVLRLKEGLVRAMNAEADFHGSPTHKDQGMVLLCAKYGGAFIELFDLDEIFIPLENILGEQCIVYSNTSSSMSPQGSNYSSRVHTDAPHYFPGFIGRVAALFMLDDFTESNGATYYLPNSQSMKTKPEEDYFYQNARRITGTSGSILYWDPRLWHAGGVNTTSTWRHAMTIVMCLPYMKQRMNVPKILEREGILPSSENARRRLGFHSQPPESYDEYYMDPKARKFKANIWQY